MRICFFNLNIYSLFNPKSAASIGGTEVQLYYLSKYFSEIGDFDVSIVTGDWGQSVIENYGEITVLKSFSLEKNFLNYLKAPFLLWKLLNKVNADIYIASSAGAEIGVIAFFCKIHKRKFIYRTASSIDCDGAFIKKNGFRGTLYRYGLKFAHVVAQNSESGDFLKKNHNIDAVIIKNSFTISSSTSPVNSADRKYILWVGRAEPNKQPEILFELAKKFSDKKFIMVAPKQGHLRDYFYEISKKANASGNIIFREKISFDKIQDYFDKAKLLICTSKYEGFPNVHLQSYMGGTPVITLNINPDDYINKNSVGYCADGNLERMVEQIGKLLSNEEDWKKKSVNALRYVKENHDIKIIGKQWKDLIDRLY